MAAGKKAIFTPEQSAFVIANRSVLHLAKLIAETNARFGTAFTRQEIINHTKKHGAVLKSVRFSYTDEQIAFLKTARADLNQNQMAEAFNAKFNTAFSVSALVQTCHRNGFKSNKKGGFQKGGVSWCAGKKGLVIRGSEKTHFKKGHTLKSQPIGYERVCTLGFVSVKVSNKPYSLNFRYKHHLVWEQHHGDIPEKHCIVFRDNNKLNCVIENLELVPKATLVLRNRMEYQSYPPELRPTLDAMIALQIKAKAAKNRNLKQFDNSK